MDKIKITTGIKRLAIVDVNDNEKCVLEFNPTDINFIERFYKMCQDFQNKEVEYEKRLKELGSQSDQLDGDGIPVNFGAGLEFIKDMHTFMREQIDHLFGEGTSQKLFGDTQSVEMIMQFLEGVTPYIQEERSKKIEPYTNTSTAKKSRTAMK